MRRFLVLVVGEGVAQQREPRITAVAADHELPWLPEHATPKRGRPNFDAAWVRAVQRRLLADGDLHSDVTGKRPGWWQLGMDVDKKPLKHAEVEAVTPCAAEECSGEVVPSAVCARTKVLVCPILKAGNSGAWRILSVWPGALRPLFENIHDDAPRKWKHSSVPMSSRLGRQLLLAPFHVTRMSEVVEEASSQALHGEQVVPTSHARDLFRHGLGRSAFRVVDTAFSARAWLVLQAAQSRQVGLAFACGAGRTQRQPDAGELLVSRKRSTFRRLTPSTSMRLLFDCSLSVGLVG